MHTSIRYTTSSPGKKNDHRVCCYATARTLIGFGWETRYGELLRLILPDEHEFSASCLSLVIPQSPFGVNVSHMYSSFNLHLSASKSGLPNVHIIGTSV